MPKYFHCLVSQVLDRENQMDNPAPWLPDASWDNITELDKLANFHGIITSFEQYPRDWNIWFTSAEPEQAGLPGQYKVNATVHTQTNRGSFVKSVWMCRYYCMSIFLLNQKSIRGAVQSFCEIRYL